MDWPGRPDALDPSSRVTYMEGKLLGNDARNVVGKSRNGGSNKNKNACRATVNLAYPVNGMTPCSLHLIQESLS